MILSLNEVSFGYRNEGLLLDRFNLQIEQSEFVVLLGPSGCGKSTLLNLSAGLLKPLAGEVLVGNSNLKSINRLVGYMTQGDTLLPWLSVWKNVALPLEFRKVGSGERIDRVEKVLSVVNLSDARDKFPSELSGGMKRRALLARSLIYEPPILLMDEPFGALDAQLREVMHRELLETVRRMGTSVLFITHDISEALLLGDRVLVLGGMPLRIVDEVKPPFGKIRDLGAVRGSEVFVESERHLRKVLKALA